MISLDLHDPLGEFPATGSGPTLGQRGATLHFAIFNDCDVSQWQVASQDTSIPTLQGDRKVKSN